CRSLLYAGALHAPLRSFPTRRSSDLSGSGGCLLGNLGSVHHRGPFTVDHAVRDVRAIPLTGQHRDEAPPLLPARVRVRCGGKSPDRKSTRLNSSHVSISYAVFCLKKK